MFPCEDSKTVSVCPYPEKRNHPSFFNISRTVVINYAFPSLYIRIATVGNTIQTVNSPMYDTYMSTPGNTAKLGTAHSNIQTARSSPTLVGSKPTIH